MFEFNSLAVTGYGNNPKPKTTMLTAAAGMSSGTGTGLGGGLSSSAGGNFSSGGTFLGGVDLSYPLLQDILNVNDRVIVDNTYREIYLMDAVSGPVIDMLALLPWSDYALVGIDDQKIKDVYESSLDELCIARLMKMFMTSNYVLGRSLGSLVFDKSRGIFTDCIIYNVSEAEITPIPFIGYDPKIDIKLSKDFKKWLNSNDPRDLEAKRELSQEDLQQMQSGGTIPLEPLKTIYVERTNLPGAEAISVYSRVLPIWLLEKCLMRGTILASTRRQKSVLHITMGSEELDYDEQQLQSVAEMFANADRDPLGAVVVTRPDVMVAEVRSPTDLWSHSSEADGFTQMKLRALMVSDSFLSGDATYTNTENTIGIMMENLRDQRRELTTAIIRDKIFLSLAKYHNFRMRTEAEIKHKVRYDVKSSKAKRNERLMQMAQLTGSRNMAEITAYNIPEIKWSKDLKPIGSATELSLFKDLNESIPLPLAMIASSAGVDIDTIINSYDEDIEVRKKIADFQKKMQKLNPQPQGEEGGYGGGGGGDFGGGDSGEDDFNFESSAKIPLSAPIEPITMKNTDLVNLLASKVSGRSLKLKPSQADAVMAYVKGLAKHTN